MNAIYDDLHEAINKHLENYAETQLEEVIGAIHILQLQFETVLRANLLAKLTKQEDESN